MPQLNPLDWGPQLVWLLLTFGTLYLLMVYVALPRIGGVMEKRAAHIAGDLAEADAVADETSRQEGGASEQTQPHRPHATFATQRPQDTGCRGEVPRRLA